LAPQLLPAIRRVCGNVFDFQQDSAPNHLKQPLMFGVNWSSTSLMPLSMKGVKDL